MPDSLQMDCGEGDGSRLSLLNSVQEPNCSLSSAGGSWVTPSRHQRRGLELPRVAVGSLCSGEQLQQVEPSTAQDLKPRSLCCAVGAHRVILGVPGRTAPSSAFEIELRDLVKVYLMQRHHLWFMSPLSCALQRVEYY